jgi:hypothetical protein
MVGIWAMKMVFIYCIAGVVAYVEVRSGGDNRSMGIKAHLRSLGATVMDKFTNDVSCEHCSFFHVYSRLGAGMAEIL